MLKIIICGVVFFMITLILQPLFHNVFKHGNKGDWAIWTGYVTVITICVIGIIQKDISFFAGVIGFVTADEIGKKMGWHE